LLLLNCRLDRGVVGQNDGTEVSLALLEQLELSEDGEVDGGSELFVGGEVVLTKVSVLSANLDVVAYDL